MQPPSLPSGEKFHAVVKVIQHERIMRYMPAAGNDLELAFLYYLWNAKLCEKFYITLQVAEVACRNTFNRALVARLGGEWYENQSLRVLLNDRYGNELKFALIEERKQHRFDMTAHHVVSALTFGFWDHLATKRFDRLLWSAGVRSLFPHAPRDASREQIHDRIEAVRRWRNRIAHHRCIFDKSPMKRHAEALDLIGWICPDTRSWVASESAVPVVLASRPRRRPEAKTAPPQRR